MMSASESVTETSDHGPSAANLNSSHNNGYSMSVKQEPETSNAESSNTNNNGDSSLAGGQATSMSNSNASSTNNDPNNTNTSSSSGSGSIGDDVCRDFLRNVCRRGKSCRFKHPDPNETELISQRNKDQYVFCHDYQNRECRRDNCRFLHCTKQEEELFRSTGKLPPTAQAQMSPDDRNSSVPVCKDFLNGTCRRGPGRCKYRHPLAPDAPYSSTSRNGPYDGPQRNDGARPNYPMDPSNHPPNMDYQSPYGRSGNGSNMLPSSNYGYNDSYADTPNKRKRYESMYNDGPATYSAPSYTTDPAMAGSVRSNVTGATGGYMSSPTQSYYTAPRSNQPAMDSRSYLEENAALRRRIDDLKKQVSDLLSTNEYLMEQLNQMRAQGTVAVASSVAGPLQQQQPN